MGLLELVSILLGISSENKHLPLSIGRQITTGNGVRSGNKNGIIVTVVVMLVVVANNGVVMSVLMIRSSGAGSSISSSSK